MPRRAQEVYRSLPIYPNTSEETVVDLSKDGIPCIPVLGDTHYSRPGGGTVPHVHPGMIEILCCRRGASGVYFFNLFTYFEKGYPIKNTAPWDFIVSHGLTPQSIKGQPSAIPESWWYEP